MSGYIPAFFSHFLLVTVNCDTVSEGKGGADFPVFIGQGLCYIDPTYWRKNLNTIYLDHNATTPVAPEVIETMAETAGRFWANPSSSHSLGRSACKELARSREMIARFIGADPSEIVFTAGGSEADNLALIGAARANREKGRHILVSAVEHHAVLASCEILSGEGFEIETLPVDSQGRVRAESVAEALRDDTILVSVMHANNEVGTIQPIAEIGTQLKERGILFHSDAAQSVGKIPVDVGNMKVDLLTCSSHKIYGPKGTGFLYVRRGTPLKPILHGGGQEGGRRAGTEDLPAIAGLARALKLASEKMEEERTALTSLRENFFETLTGSVEDVTRNSPKEACLPGTLSLAIGGISSATLLLRLDERGIRLSASAACTSGSLTPSHVLTAMGVPPDRAGATLRISFGRSNREEEIPRLVEAIRSAVQEIIAA